MFIPLAVIAAVFLGVWLFAIAIECQIHPKEKEKLKSARVLPESGISLTSLLLFLFAPTRFTSPSHFLKLESEFHREAD